LNDAKVAFNRDSYEDVGSNVKEPYTVSISGFTGLSLGDHSIRIDNSFSFINDATFYHGRNTFKAGKGNNIACAGFFHFHFVQALKSVKITRPLGQILSFDFILPRAPAS